MYLGDVLGARQAGVEISPLHKELAQMTTPARNSSPESVPGQNIHHAGIVAGAAKRTGVFGPFESADVTGVLQTSCSFCRHYITCSTATVNAKTH